MKQYNILFTALLVLSTILVFSSCNEDEEIIKAVLEIETAEINVPYLAGDSTVSVTANNDYTVTVDESGADWLNYEILDNGNSIRASYLQNDSTLARTSRLIIINDDVMRFFTVSQDGKPSSSITEIDIEYSVSTGGGFTILSISAEECDKIPIGATVTIECGNEGTISLLDATYEEFVGGGPVNGIFSIVWTQEIANITATDGITTGVLRDGFEVNAVSAIYKKSSLEYSINSQGGYTILSVTAEECAKIPTGANVVFECPSDDGTISLLDPTYTEFAGGSPVNGKFSFGWTNEIVDITAENGITTGVLRDGFDVSSMYFTFVKNELEYSINTEGGYTILSLPVEECAKIPIGATVVFECPSDAGTISLLDDTYTEYAGGSPVDGIFSFVWTKEIATINATSGITTAVLRDGFNITSMYCHN